MAFSQKAGVFTANTSTGNQAVTGLGFQPKAIMFWGGNLTADGVGAGGMQFIGFAASSSQRAANAIAVDDAVTPSNTGLDLQNLAIVLLTDGTPTVDALADFVSMDADGFTINWSDAPAAAVKINYWAVGGTDITNVEAGLWTGPTNSGLPKDHSKTGMSFQPDVVLFAPVRNRTAVGTTTVSALGFCGFTKFGGSFQQAGSVVSVNDAQTSNASRYYERVDKALIAVSTTLVLEATAVSFNSDGWTLNFTSASTSSTVIPYLAIKGGQWKIGSDLTPTTTGSQAKTGVGFTPKILLTVGQHSTASSSVATAAINASIGAATSSSAARATGLGISSTGLAAKNSAADAKIISTISSSSVVTMEAALTSLDGDGWTLNFGTVQGTQREYIWLAGGVAATPPSNLVLPAVTGAKYVGGVLATDNGTWSPAATSYTYQWQRDTAGDLSFSNIASATSSTYTLVGADQDNKVRCVVTAINSGGSTAANSNAVGFIGPGYVEPAQDARVEPCANPTTEIFTAGANLPVNTVAPAVTGSKWSGSTLTTTNGTWTFSPSSYTYLWERADDSGFTTGVATIGANQNTFVLTASEIVKYVRCTVTATNADGPTLGPTASNVVGLIGPGYTEPTQDARVNIGGSNATETYFDPAAGPSAASKSNKNLAIFVYASI